MKGKTFMTRENNEEKYLTVKNLADRYCVSESSIYNLIRNSRLPIGEKVGHSLRWKRSDIEAFENDSLDRMESLITSQMKTLRANVCECKGYLLNQENIFQALLARAQMLTFFDYISKN